MKKDIEYLYYVKKAYWHNMSYRKALHTKIALSNVVISYLQSKHYLVKSNEDTIRINACLRAIKFNEGLIDE